MPRLGSQLQQSICISVSAFRDALSELFLRSYGDGSIRKRLPRSAIAVSGGVDSMALAKLCINLKTSKDVGDFRNFQFQALIVDHKARKGSDVEARKVQQSLKIMGIESHILPLTWPPNVKPLNLPDFETQARRLRYRALGDACRALHLPTLLLAHHADDQAETVLMRLADGHKGTGLQGIRQVTEIPECWGLHGIHESGDNDQITEWPGHVQAEDRATAGVPRCSERSNLPSPSLFEEGGIKIMRPLLGFAKRSLIETCRAEGVTWFEDTTNKDTWRTPRNTVRSLSSAAHLPRALSRESILSLADRVRSRETKLNHHAILLADCSQILRFDIRSGRLDVHFVDEAHPAFSLHTEEEAHDRQRIAALLIRRFVKLVTPLEEVPLQTLRSAVDRVFPGLDHSEDVGEPIRCQAEIFTVAGVHFQLAKKALLPNVQSKLGFSSRDRQRRTQGLEPNYFWTLTRAPYTRMISRQESPPVSTKFDGISQPGMDHSKTPTWSAWQLWDGRFWIQVANQQTQSVTLRPFCKIDMQRIHMNAPANISKKLKGVLASAAPGKVRWTLPVIAEVHEDSMKLGNVLAFPTLGRAGIIDVVAKNGSIKVAWKVRYKKVDLRVGHEETLKSNGRSAIISWQDS